MNAKSALCMALLEGRVLNVKNVFETIGLTNAAREVSRMVEIPFGVEVSRTPRIGQSRYGSRVTWIDYYLRKSQRNKEGIAKMRDYVKAQLPPIISCKTDKERNTMTQARLFLDTL